MSGPRVAAYGLLAVLAAFTAVWLDVLAYRSLVAVGIVGRGLATGVILVTGSALMVWGFRSGWDWRRGVQALEGKGWDGGALRAVVKRIPETGALVGAFMWVLIGYVDSNPTWWNVLAPFLLPWLLLLVDLEPRHRLVLLAIQWLSTAMLLEVWAGSVATTALFGLALIHITLVWVSLPEGPLRRVPLGVAVVLGAVTVSTAAWFLLNGPTLRRGLLVATLLVVAGVATWLARNRHVQAAARLPVLVSRRSKV